MPTFDPNSAASDDSGIFGLPYSEKEAALVYLPVPWEATTSYGEGTAYGPSAILEASHQVDLFDGDVMKPYECGLFMQPESSAVMEWNDTAKSKARSKRGSTVEEVNRLSAKVNEFVYQETLKLIKADKIVGVVGGDHSVPLGALKAVGEKFGSFGILHFDAHSDTRKAYEGFIYSHASIMYNVLEEVPHVEKLVQVGIRDFCEEEFEYIQKQGKRVSVYYDSFLSKKRFEGTTWKSVCEEIVKELPKTLWVSFDIDGLDPRLCPSTGTPVPGGLDFQEACYLLGEVVRSGRKILGFDLNEVAPDPSGNSEWDANVGARLLYKLTAWTLASQGRAKLR